jgi:NCS1 family nucleobase:cation symporter-1
VLPVSVGLYLIFFHGIFAAYAVIPCWIACGVIYLALSVALQGKPEKTSNDFNGGRA